jgi:hypothetical protein
VKLREVAQRRASFFRPRIIVPSTGSFS